MELCNSNSFIKREAANTIRGEQYPGLVDEVIDEGTKEISDPQVRSSIKTKNNSTPLRRKMKNSLHKIRSRLAFQSTLAQSGVINTDYKNTCINCCSAVNPNNSYGLSSEFKIEPSRRKIRRIPEAANWKSLKLTVSQALDVIFQVSDRYHNYTEISNSFRLCTDCMMIFNPLFQLYLHFITVSHNDSYFHNALRKNEAARRNLNNDYLSSNRNESDGETYEAQEGGPVPTEPPETPHNVLEAKNDIPQFQSQPLNIPLPSSIIAETEDLVKMEMAIKVEPQFFMVPEIDCDEEESGVLPEADGFEHEEEQEPQQPPVKRRKKSTRGRPRGSRKQQSTTITAATTSGTSACTRKSSRTIKHIEKLGISNRSLKVHKCDKCNEIFRTRDILIKHASVHAEGGKHLCNICNCTFTIFNRHLDHMFKMHPDVEIPGKGAKYSDFKCPRCCQKFVTAVALKRHLVSKHFQCPVCQLTFVTIEDINSHMESHPPDWLKKPPIVCDLCGYKTQRPVLFRRHRVHVHSLGEAKFTCDICGKKVMSYGSLLTHQACHSDERPVKCDQCHMTYKVKADLRTHKQAVHDGIKYICEICGHASGSAANLRKHVACVHHGIKQKQKRTLDGLKKKRFQNPLKDSKRKTD